MTVADLDALLSEDGWPYASTPPVEPADPGRFHALFGRDALITALQVLPARPSVARATLRALVARQGAREDPGSQEEPGKIGHEFRSAPPEALVAAGWPQRGEFRYFATADATSWFLVVLAATRDPDLIAELGEAWRAAAGWLARALDAGAGLVRHAPGTYPGGLVQQGWRDTTDPTRSHGGGILRPDGTAPEPPLADADTQAVTVAALRAVAALSGDPEWTARERAMRERVSAAFGAVVRAPAAGEGAIRESAGPDVMALEAGDRPVAGAGSQLGWLLWAGALAPDAAAAAAARLCEPDILTDFGLRTLSSAAPQFASHAYHRGSIWPFDSWLGWGGLRAAGRADEAERVRTGVLAALARLGRAPELYAVGDGGPEPAALANHVQAWTVGARWALEHRWDGRP